jgi:ribulose-phosphate 3-epimerase
MTTIAPSLLSCDFLNIESEMKAFDDAKNLWYHLDIMDGHFVPNLTFGHPIVKKISKISKHPLDAHFMVTNPDFYIETFKDYKIHNFTFHLESTNKPLELINRAKIFYPSVGISIKPNTQVSDITPEILKSVNLILVMSVEPGFGGQPFLENSIKKVHQLSQIRQKFHYTYSIQVDGGINHQNSLLLINEGADNLVAGSAVFKDGPNHYLTHVENLRKGAK